jgi:hypothetical protein
VPSNASENGTAGMWITARVKLAAIGCGTPGRWNVTFTRVPGVPNSALLTCVVVQPRVLCVSTWAMRSPSCTPAPSAGEPGKTRFTLTYPPCAADGGEISIPMPA